MKRILSFLMAALLLVSAIPVTYAAEGEHDYSNGTQITLVGTQETQGAQWTVTVPAKMQPGQTGTVTAQGTWAADEILNVGAPCAVTLAYGAQTMDVAISFHKAIGDICGFSQIGSSTDEISVSYDITVSEASRLFGTWEGIIEYDVKLIEKGDVNQDGVIDQADIELLQQYSVGQAEISDAGLLVADVNGITGVDSGDSTHLNAIVNLQIWSGFEPQYTPNAATE